ncbi:MAG: hypothetical protein JWO09_2913 [Bacteroidetes bacterium]|nr:hypothetical protein [Bacteroidota bacterium]
MQSRILISLLLFARLSYSRENSAVPDTSYRPGQIHFVKVDLLKSAFCQFHVNYEFFNGKHLGEEVGLSLFYPNRVISFVNEEPGDLGWFDRTAGHYRGYGLEFRQKYYFPRRFFNPYIALALSYKYKHCEDVNVWIIDEFRSSSYSFNEVVSATRKVYSVSAMCGFASRFKNFFTIDAGVGIGIGYYDYLTTHNYPPPKYHYYDILPGQNSFYSLAIKAGFKIGFGFRRKEKK